MKNRDKKRELAHLIDDLFREKQEQMERLGYCTTTEGWQKISRWVDETIEQARYGGSTWWDRNWFPVVLLGLIAGSLLIIGFVNGWS